ncbi:dTDP-4-dehydrorhamnose reductase [Phenylobacterium sp.]|uniref:dTDP-4-dehydrorhamnose reductase n=1 Tax=Phenylobacterium sp. TaxID=1871053 RepID=UPI002DE817EC|nr:dTDP-4-dehydrorhamnose reductase [Phenylobacterium sp.]
MSVRVLQFGTTGQLARELIRQAPAHPLELTAVSRQDCDFEDPEKAARIVHQTKPDLVIIAAAYTAVDAAEADVESAFQINSDTPAAIAGMCGANGPALVNFSTDYVFDGLKGAPYLETDRPEPLGAYGRSKQHAEHLVTSTCPRALVLRTSWVVSAHGRNFVKTMLRLAGEGRPIRVVDDQFGRPTSAADLAAFVLSQAPQLAAAPAGDPRFGLFHFANAGETSWKAFAEAIFEEAYGPEAPVVEGIATAGYPAAAPRPPRGTLDTRKLETVFGYAPRPWREALAEIVAELKVTA